MKKVKRYLCIVVTLMTLVLTGCGTELIEMTKDEESLIVQSAAYFVAKHNVQQKDGVNGYPLPEDFEEQEDISKIESESESESELESENQNDVPGSSDVVDTSKPSEDMITLAELIGHKDDIKVSYEGSYASSSYMEGSAYSVDAEKGKVFYVMKLKLTNTTGSEVEVNNALKSPIVKLVSDVVTVKSEVTFLNTDFSTYKGTIKAGESVETILLFEVSESVAEKIKAPTLQITIDNTVKTIKL